MVLLQNQELWQLALLVLSSFLSSFGLAFSAKVASLVGLVSALD